MSYIYSYKIGVGYDLPDGSLTNIEAIRAPGDKQNFYPPYAFSAYNPGTSRQRLDVTTYETGYPSTTWGFRFMTLHQYQYLKDTVCINNGYFGTVTIETPINGTYTRRNAVMILPKPNTLTRNFTAYTDVQVQFIKLQTPSS